MQYKHTQIGYLTLAMLGGSAFFIASLMAFVEFYWVAFIVLVFFSICAALFATLVVEMDRGTLEIRFGPGVIRKSFPVKDIESCRVVKNPWYYGWGIRLTPYGWLYNVSGFLAVEIQMKSGRKYRIGTDDPEQLAGAIQQSLEKQSADGE